MTGFFEIFNPGQRHAREQRDLENTQVVDYGKGAWGPKPHDLESGSVEIRLPKKSRPAADDAEG